MKPFNCFCCGGCCGPVACNKDEWAKIEAFIRENGVLPIQRDALTCMLLGTDNQCMIYPVRPTLCRLHGRVFKMPCPNNPDAKIMSFRDERAACEGIPGLSDAIWLMDPDTFKTVGTRNAAPA